MLIRTIRMTVGGDFFFLDKKAPFSQKGKSQGTGRNSEFSGYMHCMMLGVVKMLL